MLKKSSTIQQLYFLWFRLIEKRDCSRWSRINEVDEAIISRAQDNELEDVWDSFINLTILISVKSKERFIPKVEK